MKIIKVVFWLGLTVKVNRKWWHFQILCMYVVANSWQRGKERGENIHSRNLPSLNKFCVCSKIQVCVERGRKTAPLTYPCKTITWGLLDFSESSQGRKVWRKTPKAAWNIKKHYFIILISTLDSNQHKRILLNHISLLDRNNLHQTINEILIQSLSHSWMLLFIVGKIRPLSSKKSPRH